MFSELLGFSWPRLFVIVSIYMLLAVVAHDSAFAEENKSATLVIKVTGFESNQGKVRISLFNSEKDWLRNALQKSFVTIVDNQSELTFENIPYGEYAVSVFHDENGNGKMDTNFLRIPTESFGFSNNAQGSFGPAAWEDAKFRIESAKVLHNISMTEAD